VYYERAAAHLFDRPASKSLVTWVRDAPAQAFVVMLIFNQTRWNPHEETHAFHTGGVLAARHFSRHVI
jgi:hypothetical protein